ncbi:hypothetical protein D3C72_1742780 [compost metagenome]
MGSSAFRRLMFMVSPPLRDIAAPASCQRRFELFDRSMIAAGGSVSYYPTQGDNSGAYDRPDAAAAPFRGEAPGKRCRLRTL